MCVPSILAAPIRLINSGDNTLIRLTGVANMKGQESGPLLSTIFIDYDNIYLSSSSTTTISTCR